MRQHRRGEAPSEKAQQREHGGGARGARGGSGAAAAQRGEREQAAHERREVRQALDEARTDEEQQRQRNRDVGRTDRQPAGRQTQSSPCAGSRQACDGRVGHDAEREQRNGQRDDGDPRRPIQRRGPECCGGAGARMEERSGREHERREGVEPKAAEGEHQGRAGQWAVEVERGDQAAWCERAADELPQAAEQDLVRLPRVAAIERGRDTLTENAGPPSVFGLRQPALGAAGQRQATEVVAAPRAEDVRWLARVHRGYDKCSCCMLKQVPPAPVASPAVLTIRRRVVGGEPRL